jgi:pimeloyl-ACP methyl ester carboxylesterase
MVASVRPERVLAVVAAQPAIGIPGAVNTLVRDQVLAQSRLPDRAAARAALPFAERWRAEVVEHTLDHMLAAHSDGGFSWRYYGPGVCDTEAELMRELQTDIHWTGPALVFAGACSTVLPPEMAVRVAARLPGARLRSLPNANHRLSQDNPEGFAALLDEFASEIR